jgi:hypothetical protein
MPRANARIRAFTEQLRRQIGSPSVWDAAIEAARAA